MSLKIYDVLLNASSEWYKNLHVVLVSIAGYDTTNTS